MSNLEKQKFSENPKIPENQPKMPNENPEKQNLFSNISDMLRNLSQTIGDFLGLENKEWKTNKIQEFFAKITGFFNGVNIEKWVTITKNTDLDKIREAFRPIIDLNDTSIELKEWDFIIYNPEKWTVEFYPADEKQETWHSINSKWEVSVTERKIPIPKPEEIEKEYQNSKNKIERKEKNWETETSRALARFLVKRWHANTGADSCGTAVDELLKSFGIKWVTPWHGRHGKNWEWFLEKDSRFKKVEVTNLKDIPDGAILTYNGKWTIDGKPNWSLANQKYWHVEIKWADDKFYSFYSSVNPGGSAKEPSLHNNFEAWKKATGLTGIYVPVSKV